MSKLKNLENIAIKSFNSLKKSANLLTILALFGTSTPFLKAQDWNITIVDSIGIGSTSITLELDNQIKPHIAYLHRDDEGNKFLQYAFLSSQGWEKAPIEETGSLGIYGGEPDIDLDRYNRPTIVYYNENDDSIWEVHENPDLTFATARIDSGVTSGIDFNAYPQIEINKYDNNKHVMYINTFNEFDPVLIYTFYDANLGSWTTPEIIDHLGFISGNKSELTLDNQDNPHTVYYFHGDPPPHGLAYATRNSNWSVLPFISGGIYGAPYPSIACDLNFNIPYISTRTNNDLICSY